MAFGVFAGLSTGSARAAAAPTATRKAARPPSLRLVPVTQADKPVGMVLHPSSASTFIVEQVGTVRPLVGSVLGDPVLDVRDQVSDGNEQGLLGLAFSRDGTKAYVHLTNTGGDTEVREYAFTGGRLDPSSMRLVLEVDQPYRNHNGGEILIDKDGLLWIALGDGGSAGDPKGSGQDRSSLLGKILRIDPTPSAGRPYGIPAGNPFADGRQGRAEIWAYGLRNPWRFSIDAPSNTVWIADVGQNQWEEVNAVPAGRGGVNYGWRNREGRHAFQGGRKPAGAVDPVYEYSHEDGSCSVTGGYVYRGSKIPALVGTYVFADYCDAELWGLTPQRNPTGYAFHRLGAKSEQISSFGVGTDGELYVLSREGPIHRVEAR